MTVWKIILVYNQKRMFCWTWESPIDVFWVKELFMCWNPRSFKGYQRRKSFVWAGHTCSVLHWGTLEILLACHPLITLPRSTCTLWGISGMNRWMWYEFSNANLRGSIFVQEEWCLLRLFAISRRIGRSAKMGGPLRSGNTGQMATRITILF